MIRKLLLITFLLGSISFVNAQKHKANVSNNITTPNSEQTKYAGELNFKYGSITIYFRPNSPKGH